MILSIFTATLLTTLKVVVFMRYKTSSLLMVVSSLMKTLTSYSNTHEFNFGIRNVFLVAGFGFIGTLLGTFSYYCEASSASYMISSNLQYLFIALISTVWYGTKYPMDLEQQQLMKMYYKSLFPLGHIFKWLHITEDREISFGLSSKSYLRFLTFNSIEEFNEKLLSVVPERIDIGAIYKDRPMKHNNPRVVGKELVFDVDLTDYPRTCCSGKCICEGCFILIKVAVRILNYSLREELGLSF